MPSFKKQLDKRHLTKTYTKEEPWQNYNEFGKQLRQHEKSFDSHPEWKHHVRDIIYSVFPPENIQLQFVSGQPYLYATPSTPDVSQTINFNPSSDQYSLEFKFYKADTNEELYFMNTEVENTDHVLLKWYPANIPIKVKARWKLFNGKYVSEWSEEFTIITPNKYFTAPIVELPEFPTLDNVGRWPAIRITPGTATGDTDSHTFTYVKITDLDDNKVIYTGKIYEYITEFRLPIDAKLKPFKTYELEIRIGGNFLISRPTKITFTTGDFLPNTLIQEFGVEGSLKFTNDINWCYIETTDNLYIYKLEGTVYSQIDALPPVSSSTVIVIRDYLIVFDILGTSIDVYHYDGTGLNKVQSENTPEEIYSVTMDIDNNIYVLCSNHTYVYRLDWTTFTLVETLNIRYDIPIAIYSVIDDVIVGNHIISRKDETKMIYVPSLVNILTYDFKYMFSFDNNTKTLTFSSFDYNNLQTNTIVSYNYVYYVGDDLTCQVLDDYVVVFVDYNDTSVVNVARYVDNTIQVSTKDTNKTMLKLYAFWFGVYAISYVSDTCKIYI